MEELIQLQTYLDTQFPGCFLIPAKPGGKIPKYKHKDGKYNADKFKKSGYKLCDDGALIVLTSGLIIIDIDDRDILALICTNIPEFNQTVICETKKGRHFYFRRTAKCDLAGIYDSSRKMKSKSSDEPYEIDIKTCNRDDTSAPGTISIPPSPNKSWFQSPHTHPILDLPDKFVEMYLHFTEKPEEFQGIKNEFREYSQLNRRDVEKLVDMLAAWRCDNREPWIRVGWALHNSGDYLNLWISWSEKSDKFIEGECGKLWENMKDHGLTLGSIHKWARDDNPDLYKELFGTKLDDNGETIIKNYVKSAHKYSIKKIRSIIMKKYDSKPHILVNLNETFCKLIGDDHDSDTIYIVIGVEHSREKCRVCGGDRYVVEKSSRDYPDQLKRLILHHTKGNHNLVLSKYLSTLDDDKIKQMDHTCELKFDNPISTRYDLPNNFNSPLHDIPSTNPNNYISLSNGILAIGSYSLDLSQIYPPDGIRVPREIYNLIVNINNTTNITNNYYGSDDETPLYYKEYQNDRIPLYLDNANTHMLLIKSFAGRHNDVARFVHSLHADEYRYFDNNWYKFEKHIWRHLDDPVLRDLLSNEICETYERVLDFYHRNSDYDNTDIKLKQLNKLVTDLKNAVYKDNIMKECREIFQVANIGFAKGINDANLLPFNNGVLDLETFEFRTGKPDDKMTLSTNIDYKPYNPDNTTSKKIVKFFEDILPDSEVREYLLKVSSLCLTRETNLQKIWILTGEGNNGKSIYNGLMRNTLGDFYRTGDPTLITRKAKSAGDSNEALSNLKSARHVMFSEPADDDKLYADKIKTLVGGEDKITTRGIYEKQSDFLPEFKLMIACNTIPKLSEDKFSIWKRIRVIHFPVLFSDNPNPNNPMEKQIDDKLNKKIVAWAPHMAGYLVHWLKIHSNAKKLIEPAAIINTTQDYKQENNIYIDYVNNYILRTNDENCRVSQPTLNQHCKEWLLQISDHKDEKFSSLKLKNVVESKFGKMLPSLRINIDMPPQKGWCHMKLAPIN